MITPLLLLLICSPRTDAAARDHPLRAALLESVTKTPGLHLASLARAFGVHPTTVNYHARRLATRRLLRLVDQGGRLRAYPPGAALVTPTPPRAISALHAVAEGAGGPADLARRLGVPRGTAGSLIAALERDGWLARDEAGALSLTEKAVRLVGAGGRPSAT